MAGLTRRTAHSLRGLWEVYLSRDASARFDWRLALGTAVLVGVPVLSGVATGNTRPAIIFTIAAFFTSLATPKEELGGRIRQFVLRVGLLTGVHALGMLTAGDVWATAAVAAVLALLVPLPGVAVTPLIIMVMGTTPQPGIGFGEHILLFAAGSLWTTAMMLTPFVGGRYRPAPPRGPTPPWGGRTAATRHALRRAIAYGDPKVRYAVRLCVCFTLTYITLTLLHVPHASWALTGILTTLRPTWGATHSRIVKRLTGMIVGCALTALLLVLTPGNALAEGLVVIAFAAVARPVRGFNYGFWPIFGTPVLLLLDDFNHHLGWPDVVERLGNNILGAFLAATTMLLLWPAHEEGRIPERLATLLDAHARFAERVATVVEFGPQLEREYRIRRAEDATADLRAARARLATRRGADPGLLAHLDDVCAAADRLRGLITVHRPYEHARAALAPAELLACATGLRDAAAFVTGIRSAEIGDPGTAPGPLEEAAYDLIRAAVLTSAASTPDRPVAIADRAAGPGH
ncbi:FUSC family protein [Streptomyces sp. NBC_00096]|uniref:FUSC family protein n=1 Tax=Streptomyces sp. NBC_00096 TaxID=2975650 RepID=UPI00324468D0